MALKCPELDSKLVCTDDRNTTYRARLAAKLLEACGRSDIPVVVGMTMWRPIRCATSWKSLDAYHDLLVGRLIG